jgi:hypothetical protein
MPAELPLRHDARRVGNPAFPAWLHTEAILEMLGPHDARMRYRELLGEETDAVMQTACGKGVLWGQTRRV